MLCPLDVSRQHFTFDTNKKASDNSLSRMTKAGVLPWCKHQKTSFLAKFATSPPSIPPD
jgi:hypothetical protein